MRPTAHIHPVPRLRMNGTVFPFPPNSFRAFVVKTLPCLPRLYVTYFLYRSAAQKFFQSYYILNLNISVSLFVPFFQCICL